jgi:hypothetical protein
MTAHLRIKAPQSKPGAKLGFEVFSKWLPALEKP